MLSRVELQGGYRLAKCFTRPAGAKAALGPYGRRAEAVANSLIKSLSLGGGRDAQHGRQDSPATAIDADRLGGALQMPMTQHQATIELLGERIHFQSLLIPVGGLLPLTGLLQRTATVFRRRSIPAAWEAPTRAASCAFASGFR